MVRINVQKSDLSEAAVLLSQVANLKSLGAPPSESSSVYLTPTTMMLMNNNEANSIVIENIPIEVVDGDINNHIDTAYMINTKKFASIIKGSKSIINILVTEDKIAIGEGSRRFDLSIFCTARKELPEIQFFDYSVDISKVVKNLSDADTITAKSSNITELSGTLFTGNHMYASDRISALFVENGGLFEGAPEDLTDLVISTDLFSTCLSKTKEKEALVGFTNDQERVVLQFGNVTIAKRLIASKFPKEQMEVAVKNVKKGIESNSLSATINIKDFMNKLKEIREIVESDEYFIKIHKENYIAIENSNIKSGADGQVIIDAQVVMGNEFGEFIGGKFAFDHLDLFSKLFSSEKEVVLFSAPGKVGGDIIPQYLAAEAGGKIFFCTPRS